MADEQQQQQQLPQNAPAFDRLENFNFLLSRHDPGLAAAKNRFEADSSIQQPPLNTTMSMEYDQTEGMGGLSVSSYDSIESERSSLDLRGYPYHAADKSINYSLPDQMLSYSTHPIYPPIPYPADEFGHAPGALTPSDVSSSISPPSGQVGSNKYSTSIPGDRIASALNQEEDVRYAAEEDRRRRNTAASARFRMKKKQREQTLEKGVRETADRNAALETRVAQLEMENRWLKNLLTEKHEASTTRATAAPSNDTADKNQRSTGSSTNGQKHIQPKKKGVGTDS